MADEKFFKRRMKKPRQEWDPHWLIKLIYTVCSFALSLAKIANGAAATSRSSVCRGADGRARRALVTQSSRSCARVIAT